MWMWFVQDSGHCPLSFWFLCLLLHHAGKCIGGGGGQSWGVLGECRKCIGGGGQSWAVLGECRKCIGGGGQSWGVLGECRIERRWVRSALQSVMWAPCDRQVFESGCPVSFSFCGTGLELRAYTLSHSASPFFVWWVFFKIGSWELFGLASNHNPGVCLLSS
jgi:hypothetical protein